MFHEYPKSLYMAGDIYAAHVIVKDSAHEAECRAQGFRGAWEPEEKETEPEKRKPGRPRKEPA